MKSCFIFAVAVLCAFTAFVPVPASAWTAAECFRACRNSTSSNAAYQYCIGPQWHCAQLHGSPLGRARVDAYTREWVKKHGRH